MKNIKMKSKGLAWIIIPLIMLGAFLVSAFTLSAPEDDPMPAADAEELWTFITEEKPYTEWDHWPGTEGMYEGQSPHGAYLKLYVNEISFVALAHNKKEMPQSSIIVKENYNKDKKLVAITPMYKIDGYNPEAGNWFWAKYSADGEVMASGKVESCISCHSKKKDDDYLFTLSK